MRVVVNQLAGLGQKTGIGHYTAELLRCMRAQCGEDQIDVFPTGWLRRAGRTFKRARPYFDPPIARNGNDQSSPSLVRQHGRSLVWRLQDLGKTWVARRFGKICARKHYDLYHEPNFIPFPSACPTVVTVHDLSVLLHPQWHPADRVLYFEKHFRRGLDQASHILAISDFGRGEIVRRLGISPERVTRTYMGMRDRLGPLPEEKIAPVLAQLGLPSQYLLYLGTIEPRKNVLRLMRAYCALPPHLRGHWPLVLVGGWGWNTKDTAEYFHNHARHRGVLHLGYVKDRYLAAVYNGARALIYPSLYEGFGLPPLEMMACGGAVIASTAGALEETIGRSAHLVEPEDDQGWRDALIRVVQDNDWWRILRTNVIQVAEPFTWERCATQTLAVYRRVLQPGLNSVPQQAAA
jgi:glycosyltransferase involved in cell wall biosynthesis